ncbi:interleukin-36 alpha-like [Dromiciops gliroides]|uniref:interleukin-36 alpha-like n=1 Tax=Dromiciops gliroides TaxID=33562 RepID=UPI001CC69AEB|nr:interleukin-36 alpha-like [Dromiciops gliroides]
MEQPVVTGIHDIHQQIWVLQGKSLIATSQSDGVIPVKLDILPCRSTDSLEGNKGNPIYIGIKDHLLCLSCVESEGHAILKLEKKDIMELYNTQKAEKSFVFYQNATDSTSTFESAAYPGWFICTSVEKRKPIGMTEDLGKDNIAFYLDFRA